MAGIYIHIPFCKQACNYCNFYFSTSLHFKKDFLEALEQELQMQVNYLEGNAIESIYFGGGTPSILNTQEIEKILNSIQRYYKVASQVEITLEANPDDLNKTKLQELYAVGINRLSIGIQSFSDMDLQFMKRAHNAKEAKQCLTDASLVGFDNLSIDLIYGVPTQTEETFLQNLSKLEEYEINHLSSYALTVEEGTPLYQSIRKGKTNPIDDELAQNHFELLKDWSNAKHWEHYEISNLCKDGNYSKHNTSYWQGRKYLGLGAAAHSFNGDSRQWNISNTKKYIDRIKEGKVPFELELLSKENQFNEHLMTSLRTIWGVDLNALATNFPDFYPNFTKQLSHLDPTLITLENEVLKLSDEGRFFADGIAASLFTE